MKNGIAKIWIVIITVVIMAGLAVGGYYFLNTKYTKDKNDLNKQIEDLNSKLKTTTSENSSDTSSSSSISSSTSNSLTTYTNNTYGYSFQYPSGYQLIDYLYNSQTGEQIQKGVYAIVNKDRVPDNSYRANSEMSTQYFMITVVDVEFGLSQITDGQGETLTDVTIAGVKGWKVVQNEPSLLDDTYSTAIYFNHGGKGYQISWKNSDAQGTHDAEIDAMVSSFRFTD